MLISKLRILKKWLIKFLIHQRLPTWTIKKAKEEALKLGFTFEVKVFILPNPNLTVYLILLMEILPLPYLTVKFGLELRFICCQVECLFG